MKFFCLLSIIILPHHLIANSKIDSLKFYYESNKNELNDSCVNDFLYDLAYEFLRIDSDSALFYTEQLLSRLNKVPDDRSYYRGYLLKGSIYKINGNFEKALDCYLKSSLYASKLDYKRGLAIAFSNMGDVYDKSSNYKNAIKYYNKASHIISGIGDTTTLATILLNTGSAFIDVLPNGYDSALVYFQESLSLFENQNHLIGVAYCKGNIGRVLSEKHEFNDAIKNLNEAILTLDKYGDNYAIASYKIRLATIYQDQGRIDEALNVTKDAYQISVGNNLLPQQRDAAERLSSIYRSLNDYKNAYAFQSEAIQLRDSINNEETIRKMADLRTEYEVAQKQAEVEKAETELALVEKEKQTQQIIEATLILVVLLLLVLAIVLYRSSKRERNTSRLLHKQKEELEIQRNQLEEVNKTKDRLFSIISHDLRGPIGVLNGTTFLIREYLETENYQDLEELTANMEYSVDKVQKLLDNLLDWAISQQGKYAYAPEEVDLNEVLLDTVSIFGGMAKAKEIELCFEQKYSKAPIVIDRNSVSTILRNLINNAIKFTNKSGNVDVLLEKNTSEYKITVKDNGVGISEGKLNTLFEIEAKKSTWGTANEKGLGIGLNLANEFVKMNGGSMEVKSIVGVGTEFIVSLPIHSKHEGAKIGAGVG